MAATARQDEDVLTKPELKRLVLSGRILARFLRYRSGRLVTWRLAAVYQPLASALLLRWLCRGACEFVDVQGNRRRITAATLVRLASSAARDGLHSRRTLRDVEREVAALAVTPRPTPALDLTRPPVYLRTDLLFDLRSGGSVGHTAGVLNNLGECAGAPPIFLTTDRMPTVRADIETHLLPLPSRYWDFSGMVSFPYSRACADSAADLLKGHVPSFVYQRYCENNYSGLLLARRLGVPLVLEYNGSAVWMNRNWMGQTGRQHLTEQTERLNLKAADLVVVVSRVMADELAGRGVEPRRIVTNPNGVDPERYRPDLEGAHIRNHYGINGKTVIGFIGTFGPWHGAEVLAEAFGLLLKDRPELRDRVRLLMIGDGARMSAVQDCLARFGVTDAAVLTGLIPQDEGPAHLAACDILASPHVPNPDGSPFFGSPTKLFEYMAMGRGIVASRLDQIGEILRHKETAWLVAPGSSEALKDGLGALIGDVHLSRCLGAAARREAIDHYTWRQHPQRIGDQIKTVCALPV